MGGQMANEYHSRLHDKLFNEGNPQYKSQDAKLKDIRSDCKEFVRAFESSVQVLNERIDGIIVPQDNSESISALRSEVVLLKSAFTALSSDVDELKKHFLNQPKTNDEDSGIAIVKSDRGVFGIVCDTPKESRKITPDGWMGAGDLTNHVLKLKESGKIKCDDRFTWRGGITKLAVNIGFAKKSGNVSRSVTYIPTPFGKCLGYVDRLPTATNTVYNADKFVKLCVDFSSDPLGVLDRFDKLKKEFYNKEV